MAGGGKVAQRLGLVLIAAGALGLAVVSWGMRAPDLRPEPDCAALGPRLPQDTTTVAVTAPNQVLRVKRQACVWWRPGKYFVDEFAAHCDGARAGFQEVGCGGERDAAGGNHFDLREGSLECLDILRAADVVAGKHLHHVCAGLPCGKNLSRGQRAGALPGGD